MGTHGFFRKQMAVKKKKKEKKEKNKQTKNS